MSQFQENVRNNRKMDRKTDGRTDGQTLFYRNLPATAGGSITNLLMPQATLGQIIDNNLRFTCPKSAIKTLERWNLFLLQIK